MSPAAPARSWRPAALEGSGRVWGIAAQLYSLRSPRNWGIGDFGDLPALIEWCGACGADVLGLNPLHALFAHDPARASPYSPCSRLFLNPLYVAIDRTEDFAESAEAQQLIAASALRAALDRLRASELVDYPGVAAAKTQAFEAMYAHFRSRHLAPPTARGDAFRAFQAAEGEALRLHALFEALQAHFHRSDPARWGWPSWPAAFHDPRGEAAQAWCRANLYKVEYHEYLQWLALDQLAEAAAHAARRGLRVGLYLDLALGADRGGSEVWSRRGLYAAGASIGAPPDEFNPRGQDWGLPPPLPERLGDAGYAHFAHCLRASMAHAGALRIDHVMGLLRLWWVDAGAAPGAGRYVHYPLEDLLDVVAAESHRHRCLVIGEDLGTVPEEVRAAMARRGILSTRLPRFERDAAGELLAPEAFPVEALATAGTHDLPTLAGWWQGKDVRLFATLGLYPTPPDFDAQLAARAADRTRLLRALARQAGAAPMPDRLADALHAFIAATPCRIALLQVEDLLGIEDQVNVPGTVEAQPNWRRKLPVDALERLRGEAITRLAARVGELRR